MQLSSSSLRRVVAVSAFSVLGSLVAFAAGARVGARLDHQTRVVSVARMPMPTVKPPVLPPTEIARK